MLEGGRLAGREIHCGLLRKLSRRISFALGMGCCIGDSAVHLSVGADVLLALWDLVRKNGSSAKRIVSL